MKTIKLTRYKKIMGLVLLVSMGVAGFICQALANEVLNKPASFDLYNNWTKATDSELAQLRGGFVLSNGVEIGFSLEKLIFLNGVETFSSFFQLPQHGALLQNGSRNFAPDLDGLAFGSVVQNHLDGQVIRTVNEINIEISNLQNLHNADLNKGYEAFANHIMPSIQYHN